MKLFEDKELTQPIEGTFSFGIVPVGETKKVTIWLKNDSSPKVTGYLKNLTFEVKCLDPETENIIETEKINILEAPKHLDAYAIAPLVLEWTPNISLEQGLKAKLCILGQKIIG